MKERGSLKKMVDLQTFSQEINTQKKKRLLLIALGAVQTSQEKLHNTKQELNHSVRMYQGWSWTCRGQLGKDFLVNLRC